MESQSLNSMALFCNSFSFFSPSLLHPPSHLRRQFSSPKASLSSSSHESKPPQTVSSATSAATSPSSSRPPDPDFNYALASPNGSPLLRFVRATESSIERVFSLFFSNIIDKNKKTTSLILT